MEARWRHEQHDVRIHRDEAWPRRDIAEAERGRVIRVVPGDDAVCPHWLGRADQRTPRIRRRGTLVASRPARAKDVPFIGRAVLTGADGNGSIEWRRVVDGER